LEVKSPSYIPWQPSHITLQLYEPYFLAVFLYSLAALWTIFLSSLLIFLGSLINHIPWQPLPIIILFILLLFISIHCILFMVPYFVQVTNIKTSISH